MNSEAIVGTQPILQLEKRKGGYFYLQLSNQQVDQLSRKKATRLICEIDGSISYRCGLNHLGDGNFYIIVATKYLAKLKKECGQLVDFQITEDPDQLGVEIPEILTVLLEQDQELAMIFSKITDGKKRSLIYSFSKLKDENKQIRIITDFLLKEKAKLS